MSASMSNQLAQRVSAQSIFSLIYQHDGAMLPGRCCPHPAGSARKTHPFRGRSTMRRETLWRMLLTASFWATLPQLAQAATYYCGRDSLHLG